MNTTNIATRRFAHRRSGFLSSSAALLLGALTIGLSGPPVASAAAPAVPPPCSLVTAAEVTQIAGALKGPPRPGDVAAGEMSCDYEPVNGAAWITVMLHDGDLASWKRRNGGPRPVALPEFGKDAFVNLDADGTIDLFTKKGAIVLRISLPTGPAALETAKSLARKALARL